MNHQAFTTLLAAHDIRPTANRLLIAATLANAASPLSMKEIEQQIQSIDKSSISRTLNLFYAHHLVHALYNPQNETLRNCKTKRSFT